MALDGHRHKSIRKFNPGLHQTDAEVVEQFVVRQHEFDAMLDVLKSNIDTPSCQHLLIMAPRGRGKTMLLARLEAELRLDVKLAQHFVPVRFMEENLEIYGLADFWLEVLFQLIREIELDNSTIAEELIRTHAELTHRWREQGTEGLAQAAVIDAADRLNRQLVLMVENMHTLLTSVNEQFGWSLRGVLQSFPQIVLVASATSRFEQLDDPHAPFFELFRLVHLKPLNTNECLRLWSQLTEHSPQNREIRPLQILTGGNPRLLVMVAAIARHRSLRQLVEELIELVDDHTDYFRAHLESLPIQERRVFVSLLDLWKPSSTGDIAARARLDVRVVSTMLGRLIARGAVTTVSDTDSNKRQYMAAERLFCMYYKLRRERNEAAVVEALLHFMIVFYDVGDMRRLSDQLVQDAIKSHSILAGVTRALENRIDSKDLPLGWKWDEIEKTVKRANDRHQVDAMVRLQNDIQNSYEKQDWESLLEIVDKYEADGWLDSVTGRFREQEWAHLAHVRSDAFLCLKEYQKVIAIGGNVVRRFGGTQDTNLLYRTCAMRLNKAGAYYYLGDFESSNLECALLIEQYGKHGSPWYDLQIASAFVLQAESQSELGEAKIAIELLHKVPERFGQSGEVEVQRVVARSIILKGTLTRKNLKNHQLGADIFGEVVSRFASSSDAEIRDHVELAWINQGFAYGSAGVFEKEIACYDGLVRWQFEHKAKNEKFSTQLSLVFKGRRLAELGRFDEALETCDTCRVWLERNINEIPVETKKWMGWHVKGTRALALMASGRSAEAINVFRDAYSEFQPNHEVSMREILRLVPELLVAGAAEGELLDALQQEQNIAQELQPMIVGLQLRRGDSVNAPLEVLEVARDFGKYVNKRFTKGLTPGYSHQKDN